MGSVLLLLRHAPRAPVLAASLVAYVALWIGDAVHGVFAAMGAPQVVILTLVVAIAAGLFAAQSAARRRVPDAAAGRDMPHQRRRHPCSSC